MSSPTTNSVAHHYFASNPAQAKVSLLRYAWYYPKWPCIWLLSLLGSLVLVLLVSWWFLCLFFLLLIITIEYAKRIQRFFIMGDANPGIVVQLHPPLVAVMVDLHKSSSSYPAVKISRLRRFKNMGLPLELGMLLPTVAVYWPEINPKTPHWMDFDPRPLECATSDQTTLQGIMNTFTPKDIDQLRVTIPLLPKIAPGLYRLSTQGWQPAPEFKFSTFFIAHFRNRLNAH